MMTWGMAQALLRGRGTSGFRGLARLLATSTMLGCVVLGAPDLPVAEAQDAVRAQTVRFAIPAQPLGTAMDAFIRTTGWQIGYAPDLARTVTTRAVNGTMAPAEALQTMLSGSRIRVRITGASSAALVDASTAAGSGTDETGATLLERVAVEGNQTSGMAATSSSAGTKTNVPVREVPQSVSVVTRKELDQRGATDLNDAVAYTPGVRMVDYTSNQGLPLLYMRGFFAESQRSYYRDGLRNGYNAYDTTVEPYGLEQISVLKGPASGLYGDALPGGLIDMRTKRPTEEAFREVQLEYGSFNEKQAAVDFGGPLTEDGTILYRFTGLKRDADTQVDHSPNDALYLAPALTFTPDDATHLTLLAQYQDLTRSGAEQSLPIANSVYSTGVTIPRDFYMGAPGLSDWNSKSTSIGYEFEHEFDNGWTLRNNLRYTHSKLDFTSAFIWTWPIAVVDDHYLDIGVQSRPRTSDSVVADVNLSGEVETGPLTHALLFGINYGYSNLRETRTNSTNANHLDIYNPDYDFAYTFGSAWSDSKELVSQYGLYAQDQVKWENWILTLNGRYDWADMTSYQYVGGTSKTDQDAHAFTGRAGLGYSFDNGVVPYASYSTSFEPVSGTDFGGNPFKPTTGTQYEVGVKYQPEGWNGLLSLAWYDLTQQNVTTSDPNNSGYSVQQGEVRSRGLELEAKGEIADGWSFVASYAYTDAEVTKDNANSSGISQVGTQMKAVPYNTASLWLNYAFETSRLEGLSVGAGLRRVGSSYTAMDTGTGQQVKIPGYTLLDAAISYDFGKANPDWKGLSLALSGTNLTDERYFTPGFYSNSVLDGKRRTVKATLAYRW